MDRYTDGTYIITCSFCQIKLIIVVVLRSRSFRNVFVEYLVGTNEETISESRRAVHSALKNGKIVCMVVSNMKTNTCSQMLCPVNKYFYKN